MKAHAIKPDLLELQIGELTELEREAIKRCLGYVPDDDLSGDVSQLWRDYEAGKVGMFGVRGNNGQLAAVSFFVVETFADGQKNFFMLATTAVEGGLKELTDEMLPKIEDAARRFGCITVATRTIRIGTVRKFTQHGWKVAEVTLRKVL